MTTLVVVGTQYGDCGKGKIVDFLSKDADYVVRYNGGNNAGHTIITEDQNIVLHLIPSGVLQGKKCVIGNGCVIDLNFLDEEIGMLEENGFSVKDRLFISEQAHIILPSFIEESKSDKIGSTGRGIAPTYSKKSLKEGLRMFDLKYLDLERNDDFRENFNLNKEHLKKFEYLKKNIVNVSALLNKEIDKNKKILFEGAQGTGLDIDFGEYPFCTSSNTGSGSACIGSGVSPKKIDKIIGVAKAYTTRVDRDGKGPLVTQLDDETGETLRNNGNEYGATTGRPRRCGWFDLVLLKHSILVNGIDSIALTKLDILDSFKEIKICTDYEFEGKNVNYYPADAFLLKKCKPVYETLGGWEGSIKGIKNFHDLPENAKKFIKRIEELTKIPISIIGTGASREDIIIKDKVW